MFSNNLLKNHISRLVCVIRRSVTDLARRGARRARARRTPAAGGRRRRSRGAPPATARCSRARRTRSLLLLGNTLYILQL